MIEGLKLYPSYKETGISWLGKVPEHWEIRRIKTLFRTRKQINSDGSEHNILSLTLRGVVNNDPKSPEGLVPKDYRTYQIFEKNDLVFKLIDLENVQTSRVGLVPSRGIMSPAYLRLTLFRVGHIRFYYQQFYDLYQRCIYNQIGGGVRSTIGWPDLGNLTILDPPLSEQIAIVRFLDYVERRIRRVIRARQKRIKLLEEYKQVLINQAVTGQIDVRAGKPYSAYKETGIPWLGKVPEHWEVVPLKRLAWFKSGTGFPVHLQGDTSSEIPFIKVSDMNNPSNEKYLHVSANTISKTVAEALGATIFPEGTIVFPKVGGALLTNKRRIATTRCCIDNNIMGCVVRNENNINFLFMVMKFIDLAQIVKPGPVPAISEGEVREIRVALPPFPEQTAIVEYLETQTAKIDTAIATTCREIELLREFRTRLISDVVTGKVDVREVAEQLPEEPELPEEEELEFSNEVENASGDTEESSEEENADDET